MRESHVQCVRVGKAGALTRTYVDRDGFETRPDGLNTGRTALNRASGCKSVGNICIYKPTQLNAKL